MAWQPVHEGACPECKKGRLVRGKLAAQGGPVFMPEGRFWTRNCMVLAAGCDRCGYLALRLATPQKLQADNQADRNFLGWSRTK